MYELTKEGREQASSSPVWNSLLEGPKSLEQLVSEEELGLDRSGIQAHLNYGLKNGLIRETEKGSGGRDIFGGTSSGPFDF